jgi:hypothetical protein
MRQKTFERHSHCDVLDYLKPLMNKGLKPWQVPFMFKGEHYLKPLMNKGLDCEICGICQHLKPDSCVRTTGTKSPS